MPPEASLTPVLLRHYEELVDYIQARFSRHDFARDVIHEVCVQLLQRPPLEPVQNPLAFLRKASVNQALDFCRARQAHDASHEYVDEVAELHAHTEDGAYHLEYQQHLQALVAVIEALPPRQRHCFLLHRLYGMAQHDIAEQIGIGRSAVSQHVRAATQRICKEWAPARRYLRQQRILAGAAAPARKP